MVRWETQEILVFKELMESRDFLDPVVSQVQKVAKETWLCPKRKGCQEIRGFLGEMVSQDHQVLLDEMDFLVLLGPEVFKEKAPAENLVTKVSQVDLVNLVHKA